jgi:hypothetical protein
VNVHPLMGIVADFSGLYKTIDSVKLRDRGFLAGPRFNVRTDKVTYFAEALYGLNHRSIGGSGTTEFAMAYGGGVDLKAGKVMIRVIEFDWVPSKNRGADGSGWTTSNTRFAFGIDVPFWP